MKGSQGFLIGFITFYFISYLFQSIMTFDGGNFFGFERVFVAAISFGILVAMMPSILNFFKIKGSNQALLFGGVVVSFVYFFLGYYALDLFNVRNSGDVVFFHKDLVLSVDDPILVVMLMSLITSGLIVGFQSISGKKK